ncbi:hypothetical protein B0H19DRAFT_383583 [Mycena capillaripes]|nr:hypothetical protein B0H19DRAFT_383583 [Mycena capillaripes]
MQQAIGSVMGTIVKCCLRRVSIVVVSERNIFITGLVVCSISCPSHAFLPPSPLPLLLSNRINPTKKCAQILLTLGQLGVAMVFTVHAFQLSSIPAVFNLKLRLPRSESMYPNSRVPVSH